MTEEMKEVLMGLHTCTDLREHRRKLRKKLRFISEEMLLR